MSDRIRWTWKKQPQPRWSGDSTIALNRNGEQVATLQGSYQSDVWFWYGRPGGHFRNTAASRVTLKQAKADCLAAFKAAEPA